MTINFLQPNSILGNETVNVLVMHPVNVETERNAKLMELQK